MVRPAGVVRGTLGYGTRPLVACFGPDGRRLWARLGAGYDSFVTQLAAGDDGSLAIVGHDRTYDSTFGDPPDDVGASRGFSYWTAVLEPDGTPRWRRDLPQHVNAHAIGIDDGLVAVGANVFERVELEGHDIRPDGAYDGVVLAYDADDATLRWLRQLHGESVSDIQDLVVGDGSIDLVGSVVGDLEPDGDPPQSSEGPTSRADAWYVRYDTDGGLLRHQRHRDIAALTIARLAGGRLAVGGRYESATAVPVDGVTLPPSEDRDGFTVELGADGHADRSQVVGGPLDQSIVDVAPTPSGFVVVTDTDEAFEVGEGVDRVSRSAPGSRQVVSRFGPAEPTGRPRPPTAADTRPGNGVVRVRWEHEPRSNGGAALVRFEVYRDGWLRARTGPDARTYTDHARNGTRHRYAVRAVTDAGASAFRTTPQVRVGRPAPPPTPAPVSILRAQGDDRAWLELPPPPVGRPAPLALEATDDTTPPTGGPFVFDTLDVSVHVDPEARSTAFTARYRHAGGWSRPTHGVVRTPGTEVGPITLDSTVVMHGSGGLDGVVDPVTGEATVAYTVLPNNGDPATIDHPDGTTEVPMRPEGLGLIVRVGADGRFRWARVVADGLLTNSAVRPVGRVDATPDGGALVLGQFSDESQVDGGPLLTEAGPGPGSFLARYDDAGGVRWAIDEEGVRFGEVAARPNGHALVLGSVPADGPATIGEGSAAVTLDVGAFLADYDEDGDLVWAYSWAPGVGASDVAVDPTGRITVAGTLRGSADIDPTSAVRTRTSRGQQDAFLARLDGNGAVVWDTFVAGRLVDLVSAIDHTSTGGVVATATVDGRAVVGGSTAVGGTGLEEHVLLAYDVDGGLTWATLVNHHDADPVGVAVGGDGSILVTTRLQGGIPAHPFDGTATFLGRDGSALDLHTGESAPGGALVAYDAAGHPQWARSVAYGLPFLPLAVDDPVVVVDTLLGLPSTGGGPPSDAISGFVLAHLSD